MPNTRTKPEGVKTGLVSFVGAAIAVFLRKNWENVLLLFWKKL